jgi:hypothetical protein
MEVKQAVPEHVMDLFEVVKYSTPHSIYNNEENVLICQWTLAKSIISQHLINKPSK